MAVSLTNTSEHSLEEIIQQRALPGLLVVEPTGRIFYASDEARLFLSEASCGREQNGATRTSMTMPPSIVEFCQEISMESPGNGAAEETPSRRVMHFHGSSGDFMIVALSFSRRDKSDRRKLIFLVVQRISERKAMDAERLGQAFGLTKREQEVVTRLVRGDSNKEIAASLKIVEYTVKDHLKHIMAKCDVGSRLSIISKVLAI